MKWNLNEWKNQLLHTLTGLFSTYIVMVGHKFILNIEIFDIRLLLVGLLVGSIVEIYQFFYRDGNHWKIYDRIRDVAFYVVGSSIIWLV